MCHIFPCAPLWFDLGVALEDRFWLVVLCLMSFLPTGHQQCALPRQARKSRCLSFWSASICTWLGLRAASMYDVGLVKLSPSFLLIVDNPLVLGLVE